MMLQIFKTKLDRRFTGYPYFDYKIIVKSDSPTGFLYNSRLVAFNRFRIWMSYHFGNSCERDIYLSLVNTELPDADKLNPTWCWHYIHSRSSASFYVTTKVMNWLELKMDNGIIVINPDVPVHN